MKAHWTEDGMKENKIIYPKLERKRKVGARKEDERKGLDKGIIKKE